MTPKDSLAGVACGSVFRILKTSRKDFWVVRWLSYVCQMVSPLFYYVNKKA